MALPAKPSWKDFVDAFLQVTRLLATNICEDNHEDTWKKENNGNDVKL